MHLGFTGLRQGHAEFERNIGRDVIRRERAIRQIIAFQVESEQVEVGRNLRIIAVVNIDRKGARRSTEVGYNNRVNAGDRWEEVDRLVRAGVLIVHNDVTIRVLDRNDRVERATFVGRNGDDIVLSRGQLWSHEGQSHVGIDRMGGKNRVRIKVEHLIVGIIPLEIGRGLS